MIGSKFKNQITSLLKEGLIPSKVALAITAGMVFGTIPLLIVGAGTALCIPFALFFRLNTALTQTANLMISPLQVALYLPFLKAGKLIFGIPMTVTWSSLINMFKTDFWMALKHLGILNLAGLVAWVMAAAIAGSCIYFILLFILTRFQRHMNQREASSNIL